MESGAVAAPLDGNQKDVMLGVPSVASGRDIPEALLVESLRGVVSSVSVAWNSPHEGRQALLALRVLRSRFVGKQATAMVRRLRRQASHRGMRCAPFSGAHRTSTCRAGHGGSAASPLVHANERFQPPLTNAITRVMLSVHMVDRGEK